MHVNQIKGYFTPNFTEDLIKYYDIGSYLNLLNHCTTMSNVWSGFVKLLNSLKSSRHTFNSFIKKRGDFNTSSIIESRNMA